MFFTYSDDDHSFQLKDDHINNIKIRALNDAINLDLNIMGNKGIAAYLDPKLYDIETNIADSVENITLQFDGTNIITIRELTNEELNKVKDYIQWQYTNGWGEQFARYPYYTYDDGNEKTEYYCSLWAPATKYFLN